jgi:hypothetical protein
MDFSKLKLEVYDLLGLVLPGLLAICQGWISLRGWHPFVVAISQISVTGLTLLLAFAFGAGNLIQEIGDIAVKTVKGPRYFRRARDNLWKTEEAELVRHAIRRAFGRDIPSVDAAFDYCLTKLNGRFGKRDLFVATSDLCRSFVVLSVMAIVPALRISFIDAQAFSSSYLAAGILLVMLVSVSMVAWRRMYRFRELSETTVFRAYLAAADDPRSHA